MVLGGFSFPSLLAFHPFGCAVVEVLMSQTCRLLFACSWRVLARSELFSPSGGVFARSPVPFLGPLVVKVTSLIYLNGW